MCVALPELADCAAIPVENDVIAYLALQAAFCRLGLEPLLYAPRAALAIDGQRSDARSSLNFAFNHAVATVLRPRASLDPLVIFLATHTNLRTHRADE